MERKELPPTTAAFVSPGGFQAYEHIMALPEMIEWVEAARQEPLEIDELDIEF